MRLVTFAQGEEIRLGVLRGEQIVDLHALARERGGSAPASMLGLIDMGTQGLESIRQLLAEGGAGTLAPQALIPLEAITLLAPIPRPRKNVFCVGVNYAAHAQESDAARGRVSSGAAAYPTFFSKAPTSVNGPFGDIVIDPSVSEQIDWEVELGVVIGRAGKNIRREEALDYVFGYTVINDVSARDIQVRHGGQFFKGKSLDGYCPMGPSIVTADELPDPGNLRLVCRVNGEAKQDGTTADMIFDVAALIESLSQGMTLEPGDVIATGTPSGVGFARTPPEFLRPGDLLETEVERLGILRNRIVGA